MTLDDRRIAVSVVVQAAGPGAVRAGGVAHGLDGVLGERARLHDDGAVVPRVEVDQVDDGACRVDGGDQGGHRGGQAGAPPAGVVVPDAGLLQAAVVDDLRAAPGQLDQGLGDDRVALLPQVDVGLGYLDVMIACIRASRWRTWACAAARIFSG